MRRLTLYGVVCLAFSGPTLLGAQEQSFRAELRTAALDGDGGALASLVRQDRLEVRPFFQELLTEAARAAIANERVEADRLVAAASVVAQVFQEQFGERSLSNRLASFRGWGVDELRVMLEADSLLALSVEIRGVEERREDALAYAIRADSLFVSIEDASGHALTLGQIGYLYYWLDRSGYLSANLVALEARREADERQALGNSHNDVGLGYRIAGDLDAALEHYLLSEAIREEIGDSLGLSRLVPNIGIVLEGMGDFTGASERYRQGAELYLAVGDTARWIRQRTNAAGVLTDYGGRHSQALALLLALEEDLRLVDDARTRALVLNTKGIVHRRLGNLEEAVSAYDEVIEISEANGFEDLLGRALNNIGVVLIFAQRPEQAIQYLERAMDALPEDDEEGLMDATLTLASARFRLRDFAAIEDLLDDAQDRFRPDPLRQTRFLKMRSDLYLATGRFGDAEEGYWELEELSERFAFPDGRIDVLFGLGTVSQQRGDVLGALSYYRQAFDALDTERARLTAEEDKAGALAQTHYLYEAVVGFLTEEALRESNDELMVAGFEIAERGRARAFLDQLAEAIAGVREGVDLELQSDLDAISRDLTYLWDELGGAKAAADSTYRAELLDYVAQMESEQDRVERELRARNPRFAAVRYPDPITVQDLQRGILHDGDLLLQYAVGDSISALWAVTSSDLTLYRLPGRSGIRRQVDLLRSALGNPQGSSPEEYAAVAHRLYQTVLAPAAGELEQARRLIVVPDGALHYLPFESLVVQLPTAGASFEDLPYLVRRLPVSYVQSASVLRDLDALETSVDQDLLAVGDPALGSSGAMALVRGGELAPLPYALREVETIADLFDQDRATVLTGARATEPAIREALGEGSYRFVHFATHGLINDRRPDHSGLALAADSGDGMLTAFEIFNLPVRADLVVLSACSTGLGQLIPGEGMVGLTRAFMYAGSPSLVVSLWNVSDASTATLMETFYGALMEGGEAKTDALRRAKLASLSDAATAHPFYWAPFVLIGRPR